MVSRLRFGLDTLATRLQALDPQQVVARGYALIETPAGELVVDPLQLHDGMALRLTLARGVAEVGLEHAKRA
jgi:exodeoxyribonuclease VII large subunit